MKNTERKKLESRGWAVGSAADFLGLTPEETAYIEMKLALCKALRQARQLEGITQTELAHRLQSSQSRVAKMEAGHDTVSVDLVLRSLLALGSKPKDIARVIGAVKSDAALDELVRISQENDMGY